MLVPQAFYRMTYLQLQGLVFLICGSVKSMLLRFQVFEDFPLVFYGFLVCLFAVRGVHTLYALHSLKLVKTCYVM